MNTFLAVVLLGAPPISPPALKFDAVTFADAKRFAGEDVTITFTVGRPPYTWPVNGQLRTICGPAEGHDDDRERTVSLIGDRLKNVYEGETLTAHGTLRIIRHEAYAVNRVHVPAWTEIRFEGR